MPYRELISIDRLTSTSIVISEITLKKLIYTNIKPIYHTPWSMKPGITRWKIEPS